MLQRPFQPDAILPHPSRRRRRRAKAGRGGRWIHTSKLTGQQRFMTEREAMATLARCSGRAAEIAAEMRAGRRGFEHSSLRLEFVPDAVEQPSLFGSLSDAAG